MFCGAESLPIDVNSYRYKTMTPKDDVTYFTISIIPVVEIAVIRISEPFGNCMV